MYKQNIELDFESVNVEIIGKEIVVNISQDGISKSQVQHMESCAIQFGVEYGLGVLLFLLNFEENDVWYDVTYSYDYAKWVVESDGGTFIEPNFESLEEAEPLTLRINYLDSSTNLIKNVRAYNLSNQIKTKIIISLEKQKRLNIPFVNSNDSGMKIELFLNTKNFIESVPISEIIKNTHVEFLG